MRMPWLPKVSAVLLLILIPDGVAGAQDPLDLRSRLDASPGGTLLGNRPGMSIGRTPPSAYQRPDRTRLSRPDRLEPPPILGDAPVRFAPPANIRLDRPARPALEGDGISLEGAIARMIACNPDVVAAREAIEQARADVVTAGLRTNPQFFTDMQLVPYRVLAPNQADVNVALPVDVSGKRRTRITSAICALRAVEWRYQDFVRGQVDNLYTVFLDALSAQAVVDRYAEHGASPPPATVDPEEASPADEAKSALRDRRLTLALLLALPDWRTIRVQGYLVDCRSFPAVDDGSAPAELLALKRLAFENRPDLIAKRWDLRRAAADVEAVRASRLDDVTFLAQPYTYSPTLPDHVGWALGITVPIPIFNRQQGNLAKAESILRQTRVQLTALERSVDTEVEAAYNEVTDSQDDVDRFTRELRQVGPFPLLPPKPRDVTRIEEGLSLLDGRYGLRRLHRPDDVDRIEPGAKSLFVVAGVTSLRFCIIDENGRRVRDKRENELDAEQVKSFRAQFKPSWPPPALTAAEESLIMDGVARILGLDRRVYLRDTLMDRDNVSRFVFQEMKRDLERRRRNLFRASLHHRKSLLRLNTVCGCVVVRPDEWPPPCPPSRPDEAPRGVGSRP